VSSFPVIRPGLVGSAIVTVTEVWSRYCPSTYCWKTSVFCPTDSPVTVVDHVPVPASLAVATARPFSRMSAFPDAVPVMYALRDASLCETTFAVIGCLGYGRVTGVPVTFAEFAHQSAHEYVQNCGVLVSPNLQPAKVAVDVPPSQW
jgi:hypothetical protein